MEQIVTKNGSLKIASRYILIASRYICHKLRFFSLFKIAKANRQLFQGLYLLLVLRGSRGGGGFRFFINKMNTVAKNVLQLRLIRS